MQHGYPLLDFNAPLSDERAHDLIESIGPLGERVVVDLGCGWGEFLLRALEANPNARGIGVDTDARAIGRAESNANARGLTPRVRFVIGDASSWSEPADVVIVIGAGHAWDGPRRALTAIRSQLLPGGRLLLGEGVWERPPTHVALAALDAEPGDFPTPAGLSALARECGYRVVAESTASREEWDSFETRYAAGREAWLAEHADHPEAAQFRAALDRHREGWQHGYRGILGFTYLVLAP